MKFNLVLLTLFLGVGVHFSGIFYPDTVLCKAATNQTPVDLEVVLGGSKVERLFGQHFPPGLIHNFNYLMVNDFRVQPPVEEDENLYAITIEVEGISGPNPIPVVNAQNLHVFSPFACYAYFVVLILAFTRFFYHLFKRKKSNPSYGNLLDRES